MILVTTAGKVGSEAARLLTERQVPVRVLVRDPEKVTALADAGAEIAVGDLDVPASIDEAMVGVTAVVLVSPAVPAQELNVVADRGPGRCRTRRQSHQQGVGRFAHRPTARADRDRGRPGRFRVAPHAAAIERLHAEHVGVGAGDRQDQQFRFVGRQGPRRYGRCSRRRGGGRRDRRLFDPSRREDVLAQRS